ncbi:MAG: imidazole glycerol phosphate synthase subunit HisH [Bacteroidaceae bacterium]|nr:imidazole glycerol phosphate synthase subunit HisH [Bacteroidaceae bacterium]MBR3856237.1 imidazole glycerol phosphate synthase subunit HisH [Bacteroidaceae bacterium]
MIAIVDYDTGNLRSVCNAIERIGAEYCVTSDAAIIGAAERVLLPGVGEASSAMEKLRERGLAEVIKGLTQPVLGICIGMQLMCRYSEEGGVDCLGIFDADVRRFTPDRGRGVKVPHIGWNSIENLRSPLFEGIDEGAFVYFVHSYAADVCADAIACSINGRRFAAALCRGNFYGTQFHPEKSGDVGEALLRNFLKIE